MVGLFRKQFSLASDFDIYSPIFQELTNGLLSIVQEDLMTAKESELFWALISSASARFLANPEEDEAIRSTIVSSINDAIAVKVGNHYEMPQILDAFKNRMNIPHISSLYSNLP